MQRNAGPALALIAIATIIPELVTGSTPLIAFFSPFTLLVLFVLYGLAILAVREIAVRLRLNFWGIYLLGMAFAVVNEGLGAKTMIINSHLPIGQYNAYGYIGGISFPWALAIGAWHALASVLLPIVAVYILFPTRRNERWLGNWTLAAIVTFVLFFATFFFFGNIRIAGTPAQYAILALMILFWFVAALVFGKQHADISTPREAPRSSDSRHAKWVPFVWGLTIAIPYFIILPGLASRKISLALFFAVLAAIVACYAQLIRKKGWANPEGLLMFGLGFYAQQAFFGIVAGISSGWFTLAGTDIVALTLFIVLAAKAKLGIQTARDAGAA